MIRVNLWDQQWHVNVHPMGAGIAQHTIAGRSQALLGLQSNTGRQSREEQLAVKPRRARLNNQLPSRLGALCGDTPRASLVIRQTDRPFRGRHGSQFEPRMLVQQLDEPLPNGSRRAQDTDSNGLHSRLLRLLTPSSRLDLAQFELIMDRTHRPIDILTGNDQGKIVLG